MKDGENFSGLINHSSVFMKNNIVLFGGKNSNKNNNNLLNIFNLETVWSKKEL